MENPDVEELTNSFLTDGIEGIDSVVKEYPIEGNQRLKLLDSIRQKTNSSYISDHLLDRMHEIHEACIAEALDSANAQGSANGNEELLMYANVTSYNLAANLADCWMDAEEPRSVEHFTAGVASAERCLELRRQLNKPPAAMAMAYFIRGVHEYSLKQYSSAESSWTNKLENEKLSPDTAAASPASLDMLLSHGLIGLARWSQGVGDGSDYEESLRRLEAERTADNNNEVELFLDELRLLKEKHGPF